ncbi:hypothetical protein Rhe02_22150 [Rhizocola hellebori]|uniref:Uncharacterized protein n=1 Tax=Rhizocola hellebori TaxID=1392758 RepID=A0A8J3Q6G6_9ACTN|nr:hypothetical protein [Rhizocola hellebori]GIH04148.1 hypothetical protein Rhe02_22150 [Rhizocola hellebori]
MAGLLAQLEPEQRAELLDDLNYLNLRQIRSFCERHTIPYRIIAGARATADTDRKPVILHRVRHFLLTGEVLDATRLSAGIVRRDAPPGVLRPSDRLYYRWYNKTYEPVMQLLADLTGGRFHNGALARVLIMEYWTSGRAPTFREFAQAWIAATDGPRDLVSGEYAFLSDLQRGEAGPDWKHKRQQRAQRFLSVMENLERAAGRGGG